MLEARDMAGFEAAFSGLAPWSLFGHVRMVDVESTKQS